MSASGKPNGKQLTLMSRRVQSKQLEEGGSHNDRDEANDFCEVDTNKEVQIKLKINTSHEDRYNNRNVMRNEIYGEGGIEEYLRTGGAKVAFEELYSTDYEKHVYNQHIRFFLDLDKVPTTRGNVIDDFVFKFTELFLVVVGEIPDDKIAVSNVLTADEISEGARVAIKPKTNKQKGGVHIYFTNIITDAVNFHHFNDLVRRIKARAELVAGTNEMSASEKRVWQLFSCIDLALYNHMPSLRCIYALKETGNHPCGLRKCTQLPCNHTENLIYIPMTEGYKFSDYFFSYLGKECYNAMHIELLQDIVNTNTSVDTTTSVSKAPVYIPENDIRNNPLLMYERLISLITNVDYNKYNTVSMAMHHKLYEQYGEEAKQLCIRWTASNYKDKSDQINHNWDYYWQSRQVARKVGLATLKKLAEESCIADGNPEAFKLWLTEYSWSSTKKLIHNFTQVDVAEFIVKARSKDYIYHVKLNKSFIYNDSTKLWDTFDDECVIMDSVTKYIRAELNKLQKSTWAKKRLYPDDPQDITTNEDIINKCVKTFSTKQFIQNVVALMKSDLRGDVEFDGKRDIISYKNVVLELRTGVTRERQKDDYLTKTLQDNYETVHAKYIEEVRAIHQEILGDNFEEGLQWIAYTMTGETTGYNAMFLWGPEASNGKNTIADIYQKCLPIYFNRPKNSTFSKKYQNSHKQLIHLDPPIRFVFVNELPTDEMDVERIKEFCDGNLAGVEIMYGTSKSIYMQCKMYVATNHRPKFKVDAGIQRRCLYAEAPNRFVPESEYETELAKGKSNVFVIKNILDIFSNRNYRLAYVQMALPHIMEFYKSGLNLPKLRQNFVEYCIESDKWQLLLRDHLVITDSTDDRMSKQDLADYYNQIFNMQEQYRVTADRAFSEGKRIGLTYNRQLRENSTAMQTRGGGRSERGVFVNVRRIDRPTRNTRDPTI